MARPLRIEFPGALYHVTARGNARQDIFLDDEDRHLFLSVLDRVISRFRLRLRAYCLTDNYYHLLLETPEGNLSKALRQLNGVYTQAFNRRHGKSRPRPAGALRGHPGGARQLPAGAVPLRGVQPGSGQDHPQARSLPPVKLPGQRRTGAGARVPDGGLAAVAVRRATGGGSAPVPDVCGGRNRPDIALGKGAGTGAVGGQSFCGAPAARPSGQPLDQGDPAQAALCRQTGTGYAVSLTRVG